MIVMMLTLIFSTKRAHSSSGISSPMLTTMPRYPPSLARLTLPPSTSRRRLPCRSRSRSSMFSLFHFPPITLTNPSAGRRLSSGFCRSVTFGRRSESIRRPHSPSESQRAPASPHLEYFSSSAFHGNSSDKTPTKLNP